MTLLAPTSLGPVSALLEAELRKAVRQDKLVLWLDPEHRYTAFADHLTARQDLPYSIQVLRGSYLKLLFALAPITCGVDRPTLVVHLPGLTAESLAATPLLELSLSGTAFERSLDDLVLDAATGKVRSEQILAFSSQAQFTLEGADAWLRGELDQQAVGLGARLQALPPLALIEELLATKAGAGPVDPAHLAALWQRFAAAIGLADGWRERTTGGPKPAAADVAFAAASWALAVEYANDLQRRPKSPLLAPARALPPGVVQACRDLAVGLRDPRHKTFYTRTANETEALLVDEIENARAEDLGSIDTFPFEERVVLAAALAELAAGSYGLAAEWSALRADGGSYWTREEPARLSAWQLVDAAARLGLAIKDAGPGLGKVEDLAAAVARYVDVGSAVDQAHRHLEQRRVALLYPQLPSYEPLRVCLDAMRVAWRTWADGWARDFNRLCRTQGFLPPPALQQRQLFDDVVRPLTQEPGPTAYFVVDALRFEMAEELRRALGDVPGMATTLAPRLAELPSLTAVGMNALAPVAAGGRLRPVLGKDGAITGFKTGEFRVTGPDERKRAMHERVGGTTCPWLSLDAVLDRDETALKNTIKQARLVVVHSQEIDKAGENGAGPAVFDGTMQKLRGAWHRLRDAGVRRFVFTADHGFLLLDARGAAAQPHGRKIDPDRRHVVSQVAADHPGEVRVALADLGYEGATGYLMFPESTAVFDRGERRDGFVHGGNSLQERVIPVLTVTHGMQVQLAEDRFAVTAQKAEGVAGMHCLAIQVDPLATGSLGLTAPATLELALRVTEPAGVQVELCQARSPARLQGGAIVAPVGARFELFFRLTGPVAARAAVEIHHPPLAHAVAPFSPDLYFDVAAAEPKPAPAAGATANVTPPGGKHDWLERLPAGGVRQLFAHLAAHGAVTELEAAKILGGPRAARNFALEFEELATRVPFGIHIDVVGGVKRYVREGSQP